MMGTQRQRRPSRATKKCNLNHWSNNAKNNKKRNAPKSHIKLAFYIYGIRCLIKCVMCGMAWHAISMNNEHYYLATKKQTPKCTK